MGKDSFLFHLENEEDIEDLTLEQKGMLFVAMITFTKDGTEPEFEDPFLRAAWRPIRRRMKADAENYEHTCEVNRANANKRWQSQKNNATVSDRMKSHKSHNAKNANYADKDTDKDIESDSETESESEKESVSVFFSADAPEEKEKNQSEPFINPEVDSRFERFKAMRLEKGKSLNADAEKIIKDKIVKFSKGDPVTAAKIIDQAIEGGYLTVIPLQKPPEQKKDDSGPGFAQHDYDMDELRRRAKA